MLAFLSSTTSFVSVPTLAVMPINGKWYHHNLRPWQNKYYVEDDDKYYTLTSKQWRNYFK
jgi:predicted proteasome-type protease